MTDLELAALLPTLEAEAERLNKASEAGNEILSKVEKRLVAANIGLEVWSNKELESAFVGEDLGIHETGKLLVQYLGFARIDGRWCLAVRTMREVSGFFEGDTSCPYTTPSQVGEPVVLLKASRSLRIAALKILPDFLVKLREHISSTVEAIESTAAKL